jgi:hypothetical protein
VCGKLAKSGMGSREALVFKAFTSAEYFANPTTRLAKWPGHLALP